MLIDAIWLAVTSKEQTYPNQARNSRWLLPTALINALVATAWGITISPYSYRRKSSCAIVLSLAIDRVDRR
jgi:hypothetical protein